MLPISGTVLPPRDDVPRSRKEEKDWCLQAAIFIGSSLYASQTLYGPTDWSDFTLLRSYGNGEQPTEPYSAWYTDVSANDGQSRINTQGTDTLGRGGNDIVRGKRVFTIMDYTPVSPMPKIKSTVVSLCTESSYKVQCDSLDPSHVQEKALLAYESYYRSTFVSQQLEKVGVKRTASLIEPKNVQQFEVMKQTGQFRLKFESGFEDMIKHTFNISDWPQIQQKTIEDGTDIGFKVGKRYYCEKTGATKAKYVDPSLFVMQWNSQHEGKHPTFVGHIERMPMYLVAEELKKDGYSTEEILKVASLYTTASNITSPTFWTERDPTTRRWVWESLTVDVLEWEYKSTDVYRMKEDEDGVSEIEEPNHRYDEEYESCSIYKGKYVIGAQVVYGFGRAINTDDFSYFWDRIPGSSITRRCRGLLDDLMKLIIKWRAEVKATAPSGYYMDMTAIANMSANPSDQQELVQQAIAAHRQTGVITGQTITRQGKTVNNTPIQPLENGPKNLEKLQNGIAYTLYTILDVAGIPSILAASPTQDKGKAVGIGEQEVISGNHALYLQKESVWRFQEFAARVVLKQIRADIMFNPKSKKYYSGILDADKMKAVNAVETLSMDDLAITLRAMPTKFEKDQLKEAIKELAMSGTRDGLVKVTEAELMFAYRLIDADQPEVAEIYVSNVVEERLAQYAAKAPEADARNKAMQMELLAAKEESEIRVLDKKIQLEGMVKSNLQAQKGIIDSKLQAQGSQEEIDEMQAEAMFEAASGTNVRNQDK